MPNINLPEDFPERLSRLRKERFLSETDLANSANVTYKTVRDLEKGKRPRVMERTLLALAEALQVSEQELLGTEDEFERIPDRRRRFTPLIGGLVAALLMILVGSLLVERAGHKATLTLQTHSLVAQHPWLRTELWRRTSEPSLNYCRPAPWDETRLLIGLNNETPAGGRILCLDRANGDTIWSAGPDITLIEEAFGRTLVRKANFSCNEVKFGNIDGSGDTDIVARFTHGHSFPCCLIWFDQDGRRRAQYTNRGHLADYVVKDLDGDGKDEVLACGTNNDPGLQGGTVIVLDDAWWSGFADDSAAGASSSADSSLYRVVFPAFPETYMTRLGTKRLTCTRPQFYLDSTGALLVNVELGPYRRYPLVLFLDMQLSVLDIKPGDSLLGFIDTWPDSLTRDGSPADRRWLNCWLSRHLRYEHGRLVSQKTSLLPDRPVDEAIHTPQ